jgi:hypothetical protein
LHRAREESGIPKKRAVIWREYPKQSLGDLLRESLTNNFFTVKAPFKGVRELLPTGALRQLQYRLSQNGKALAMLPL